MRDDVAVETEATELLRTLIRNGCVNTGEAASGHEDRSVDALEDFFAGSGLSCERYTSQPGRMSLITRIEGTDRQAPALLLMGHTDVVPVNASGWQRDPFAGDLVDGIVWGRGAIDMLNLTSTMAVATRRLAASGWKPRGTLIYLAVADEEAGGFLGAGHLVEHHADAVKCDYVITESGGVPIPTKSGHTLKVTVGEKGGNWRRLVVHGTPGHGSRPFRTDNALVTAARVIQRLAEYRPKARILDAWRGYVEALELEPGLTDALVDPDRVWETARDLDNLALAREAHACTHTTFSPNIAHNLISAGTAGNINSQGEGTMQVYKTGKIVWRKPLNGGSVGLLSTAGGVLFLSNGQNVEAWDAATGKGLWYSQIGGLQSPPETFMLDGKQHMLFASGGSLYMFVLN